MFFSSALFAVSQIAFAADVHLAWNKNNEPDLSGYKLYYGTVDRAFQYSLSLGNTTDYDIRGLPSGYRYYFAVSAYDRTGLESKLSDSISIDLGYMGGIEQNMPGFNSSSVDSDGDGVADSQELLDGTNPNDRGSSSITLGTTACTEWNGFLDNLWNILELSNRSVANLHVNLNLYNDNGVLVQTESVTIAPHQENDVLVHNLQARQQNAYGLLCVTHDGQVGDIAGRMVYYRVAPDPTTSSKQFQFAFALPLSGGRTGEQYITYNTYQPSFDPRDAVNTVANWVQVTNVGQREVTGNVVFYGQQGNELDRQGLTIAPRERVDVAAHRFGEAQAGLVRWVPEQTAIPCIVRNARYYYDNPALRNSFVSATSIDAQAGSGQNLTVPVNTGGETSVLEVANVTAYPQEVVVDVYNGVGNRSLHKVLSLQGFESRHVIVNEVLTNAQGVATVEGKVVGGVVANVVQYGRSLGGSLLRVYAEPVREGVGVVLEASYNTFINQTSNLLLANTSGVDAVVNASISQLSGEEKSIGENLVIPPRTVREVSINNFVSADRYGLVTVNVDQPGSIVASLERRNASEYVIALPLS